MNSPLRQLSIACLIVACVHLALSAYYRDVVMGNGIAERTQRQYDAMDAPVRLLALGDSHMKWGFRAAQIDGAFNFALPGESLVQSYYRLESLLEAGAAEDLRAVVLQADPHTLSRRPDDQFLHYYARFVDPLELARVDGAWLETLGGNLRGRYVPYAGQRANLMDYVATGRPPEVRWLDQLTLRAGGLVSEESVTRYAREGRRAVAEQRIRYHFGRQRAVDPTLLHYLERILALCEARGLRALFVRFPLHDSYLEALGDAGEFDRALRVRIEASPAAETLDLRHAFRGDDAPFSDVDHLNATGAARLTRFVARWFDRVQSAWRRPRNARST